MTPFSAHPESFLSVNFNFFPLLSLLLFLPVEKDNLKTTCKENVFPPHLHAIPCAVVPHNANAKPREAKDCLLPFQAVHYFLDSKFIQKGAGAPCLQKIDDPKLAKCNFVDFVSRGRLG